MRWAFNIWRLIETGATLERTGALSVVLNEFQAPTALRVVAKIVGWPLQCLGKRGDPEVPPITRALTALGPAYIKFGQILSTRPDVIGDELATQLRVLQDKLPPFATSVAKAEVEAALEITIDDVFSEFSDAVAAASIAQVHRARLRSTGQAVAIKILRPGIEKAFQRDIDAFYTAARMIEFLAPAARRLRSVDVVEHFEGVVTQELDLRLETSSAAEFAQNTSADAGFRLPGIIWPLSSRRVMALDWAEGIPVGDVPALRDAGHDLPEIGQRVMQLFLSHALRDGYFHGDMHQGNMKIAPNGDIIAFDFGIMGRIDAYSRRVYAEIIYGFIKKDYRRVAEVHFEAGYVPAHYDVDEFAVALRAVGEPIFGMEASKISMARLLSHLFDVTEKFGMETRTELLLLQRTMVVVEGVARSLDPHINIWEVARPVVEKYIKENIGPQALVRDVAATLRILSRFGPQLPKMAETLLIAASQAQQTSPARETRRTWVKPLATALLGAGVGVAGAAVWFVH